MPTSLFRLSIAISATALAATALPPVSRSTPLAVAPDPVAQRFETTHQGIFNGKEVEYRATVQEMILRDDAQTPTASVFLTSYVAVETDPARPVLFMFNGGPGAPSLWLHMGAFGPKRVDLPKDPAVPIPADAPLIDNPHTVLDVADIVFLDPPGTGLGRILPGAKPRAFYHTMRDGEAVGEMIARWLSENGRESSPKYLLGESYGTIRAAAVVRALLAREQAPIAFDGVILMGQALNMIETSSRPQNIIGPVVSLPGEVAIARYHGRIARNGRSLEQVIAEAQSFAQGPYLAALVKGNRVSAAEGDGIAQRLSDLTGVSKEYFLANGLVVSKEAFRTELLKDKGLVLGRYDARYVAPVQAGRDIDASNAITPVYLSRFGDYLKDMLAVPLTEYRLRDPGLRDWDYGSPPSPFSDWPFARWLADAMAAEPRTRLLIGTGVYDLTTTIGAADYLLAHTDFAKDRVTSVYYPAGHMAYTDPDVLRDFTGDVRRMMTR